MFKLDIMFICYTNGNLKFLSGKEVNQNISEDQKIVEWDGVGNFSDFTRSWEEYELNLTEDNLLHKSAKMYITVSSSEFSDDYYASTSDVVEIDLNSTAGEVRQKFNSRFPESIKPMVILKLYYVTRQT